MIRGNNGQSVLEYVIVLTAVVGIIAVAVYTSIGKKDSSEGLGKLMNQAAERIKTESAKIPDMVN